MLKWAQYVLVRAVGAYTGKTVVSVFGSSYIIAGNMVKKHGRNRKFQG